MRLLLLLFALAVSGCATSSSGPLFRTQSALQTLGDVNAALTQADGLEICLADGRTIRGVEAAVVSEHDVRFLIGGEPAALPMEQVTWIVAPAPRRARRGAAVGATPGLVLLGFVGLGALMVQGDNDIVGGLILLAFGAMAGASAAAVGLGVGSVVGSNIRDGDDVALYQGPVECYLAPPASPLTAPTDG